MSGDAPKMLTVDECIAMQDRLITGYMTEDFQGNIWQALGNAGGDALKEAKARQECCMQVQKEVLPDFGFEATREGVAASTKAFTPELNNHPVIAARNAVMQYLISPEEQRKVRDNKAKAPPGIPNSRINQPEPGDWPEGSGKVWVVTGGKSSGGIVVRATSDPNSAQLAKRLTTGSKLEQLEREGDRMKFERIDGGGPDIGWVSLTFKGKPIVEPLWFKLSDSEQIVPPETWAVVHDRVAKRDAPNKDAKMLGLEKKGSKVKGHVIEEAGVRWLKIKTATSDRKDMVDAYMMIDGQSVGLGVLLEKKG